VSATDRLRREGIKIELALVENMQREQARAVYESADLVVDQLLAGWYGGLAVEAMALGKPVVSYIRDADLAFIPEAMRAQLPLINADPRTIYDVLRRLATSERATLPEHGRRGRAYVERWHDPYKIAAQTIEDYVRACR
jgi:glycosyltransferase involved in cell wall biosynthesis